MFAGHFGLAAGIKALDSGVFARKTVKGAAAGETRPAPTHPEVPLWALMLSTQLLDVIFALMVLVGVESYGGPGGYGEGWIHASYSHSLAGALLIALGAGMLARGWWGTRGGLLIGATVFSHWLLDLVVHRPDLPLLPGNLGNLPLLGFGLWSAPLVSFSLEALLVVAGAVLYIFSVRTRARASSGTTAASQRARPRAVAAGVALSALLVLALLTSVLGI